MPTTPTLQTIETTFSNLLSYNIPGIVQANQGVGVWNGLTINDLQLGFNEIKETFELAAETDAISSLPWNALNSILGQMTAINTQLTTLQGNANHQGTFQQLMSHVESLRTQLRQFGVHQSVRMSPNIPNIVKSINTEVERLTKANNQAETLTADISNLISPAIAGQLSTSFSKRKKFIFWGRVVIGAMFLGSLYFGFNYTKELVQLISDSMKQGNTTSIAVSGKPTEPIVKPSDPSNLNISYILLRSAVLIPLYLLIIFLIRQYSKERSLEEDYAHKETIASTLKTYGELLKDEKIKDDIVSKASQVIFSSPGKETSEEKGKSESNLVEKFADKIIEKVEKLTK